MIGVLGGSFDPVHSAHLAMADAFAAALSIDELRFLPAARPWQKDPLAASADDRAAMLDAALAAHAPEHGRYVVDRRELGRPGATYTADTLTELRAEFGPTTSLVFLMGADQLVHLDSWYAWRSLWDHAHLAAATRPGFDVGALPRAVADAWSSRVADAATLRTTASGCAFLLADLDIDISATGIRAALASGTNDDEVARMVPSAVLDYIRAKHLYRS